MATSTTTNTGSIVSGQVSNVNDNGVQLDGEQWYNLSKFGTESVVMPFKGMTVNLRLDKTGRIRTVEAVGGLPRPPQAQTNSQGTGSLQQPFNRDRSIVLQTIIKASGEVLHSTSSPEDFPVVADGMLDWYESRITASSDNRDDVEPEELGQLPF